MAKESDFQKELINDICERFKGAIVLKNDPRYKQGVPDLTVFYKDRWATLECKKDKDAHHQPNQDYYIQKMDSMSFSRFIYPENKEEVLNEMEQSFSARRTTRVSKRK